VQTIHGVAHVIGIRSTQLKRHMHAADNQDLLLLFDLAASVRGETAFLGI
jgi:hypothetical protein